MGLRILMYCRYFPPEYSGAAMQAISLARELRARGHHVEVATQLWPGLAAEDEVDGFPVVRLAAGRSSKHREIRLWWNLARYLRRRRRDLDILHSHGAYYTDSIIGPLGRWLGMRSLVKASLANNDLRDLDGTLVGRAHRWMLGQVDACIAISRDLVREFERGGVAAHHVHYLPNGVDVERFRPSEPAERAALRRRLDLPEGRPVLLYVGVFDERKNIDWLARRWCAADGFGTDGLLLAVGPQSREDPDGRFKGGLVSLAEEAPSRLRILGAREDVADLYRAADLFILPSRAEGLPNAMLEAMACGLPVVAADVSGSRELVTEGATGFLFSLGDENSLEGAIRGWQGADARRLGEAARRRVESGFDLRRLAERYEALYEQLLAGRS